MQLGQQSVESLFPIIASVSTRTLQIQFVLKSYFVIRTTGDLFRAHGVRQFTIMRHATPKYDTIKLIAYDVEHYTPRDGLAYIKQVQIRGIYNSPRKKTLTKSTTRTKVVIFTWWFS